MIKISDYFILNLKYNRDLFHSQKILKCNYKTINKRIKDFKSRINIIHFYKNLIIIYIYLQSKEINNS